MAVKSIQRVTIKDVAARAGVGKATVSYVLNSKNTRVPIGKATQERVFRIAKEMGYRPSAAARALATQRSGYLGFILSDVVIDGWANAYFGAILQGIESEAHKVGYGLNVSRYNLSNIDSFVLPERVGQRSVDGLLLAGGYIQSAVIERFSEFGIPCVSIGDKLEVAGQVPTVATNYVAGLRTAIEYLRGLGHRMIGHLPEPNRRGNEIASELAEWAAGDSMTKEVLIETFGFPSMESDFHAGQELFARWHVMPAADRPTAMVLNYQVAMAFLRSAQKFGLRCPDDISIVVSMDTIVCEQVFPSLTAIYHNLEEIGSTAVHLLFEHLDRNQPLGADSSRNDFKYRLIERDSCRRL